MLFPTFLEKINSGNKKINIFLFRKTIVDKDTGILYPIYIKKKIVVLASEPVGGRISGDRVALFVNNFNHEPNASRPVGLHV